MKKYCAVKVACVAFVLFAGIGNSAFAALFTQDFESSTVVSDYVDSTNPTTNQFTLINGPTSVISIENGRLKYDKTAGNGGNLRRWVALDGSPVGGMSFSFDMEISFSNIAFDTRLYTGLIGEPGNTENWMAWGINSAGVDNEWLVNGATNYTFTGSQTLTMFLNDTDVAFDYTDPTGGSQSLAAASYDLWVGNVLVADGKTGTFTKPEKDLTAFSIGLSVDIGAVYYFDNVEVTAIPEPATLGLFGVAGGVALLVRRLRL